MNSGNSFIHAHTSNRCLRVSHHARRCLSLLKLVHSKSRLDKCDSLRQPIKASGPHTDGIELGLFGVKEGGGGDVGRGAVHFHTG